MFLLTKRFGKILKIIFRQTSPWKQKGLWIKNWRRKITFLFVSYYFSINNNVRCIVSWLTFTFCEKSEINWNIHYCWFNCKNEWCHFCAAIYLNFILLNLESYIIANFCLSFQRIIYQIGDRQVVKFESDHCTIDVKPHLSQAFRPGLI